MNNLRDEHQTIVADLQAQLTTVTAEKTTLAANHAKAIADAEQLVIDGTRMRQDRDNYRDRFNTTADCLHRVQAYAIRNRRALTLTYTTIVAMTTAVRLYHGGPPAMAFVGRQIHHLHGRAIRVRSLPHPDLRENLPPRPPIFIAIHIGPVIGRWTSIVVNETLDTDWAAIGELLLEIAIKTAPMIWDVMDTPIWIPRHIAYLWDLFLHRLGLRRVPMPWYRRLLGVRHWAFPFPRYDNHIVVRPSLVKEYDSRKQAIFATGIIIARDCQGVRCPVRYDIVL